MTRDDVLALLKPAKTEVRKIDLPDGGSVCVRRISLNEKDRWEDGARDAKTGRYTADWRAKFLVVVLCDEDGKRLFGDNDWPMLKDSANALAEIIFDEAYVWGCGSREMLEALKNASKGGDGIGSASPSV